MPVSWSNDATSRRRAFSEIMSNVYLFFSSHIRRSSSAYSSTRSNRHETGTLISSSSRLIAAAECCIKGRAKRFLRYPLTALGSSVFDLPRASPSNAQTRAPSQSPFSQAERTLCKDSISSARYLDFEGEHIAPLASICSKTGRTSRTRDAM